MAALQGQEPNSPVAPVEAPGGFVVAPVGLVEAQVAAVVAPAGLVEALVAVVVAPAVPRNHPA